MHVIILIVTELVGMPTDDVNARTCASTDGVDSTDGGRSASSSSAVSTVFLSEPQAAATATTTDSFPMEIDNTAHPSLPQTVVVMSQQSTDRTNTINRPVMTSSVTATATAVTAAAATAATTAATAAAVTADGKRKHSEMSRVLTNEPNEAAVASSSNSYPSLQSQHDNDQGINNADVVILLNILYSFSYFSYHYLPSYVLY